MRVEDPVRLFRAVCCSVVLVTILQGQGYTPPNGFVPDSVTAVKVAEAVLIPVYGNEKIESERPFTASLKHGVWTVAGTLRCPDGKGGFTTDCDGGVATVQISKADARIVSMTHYK